MQRSKLLMILFTTVLILTFTITPAAALFEPQAGTVDEDGDLIEEVLPSFAGEGADAEKNPAGALPEGSTSGDDVSVDSTPLAPISYVDLFVKTPTFVFSKDAAAVKYKIEVWNAFTNTLVYTVKTSGNCIVSECSVTPITPLKNYVYTGGQGLYKWRVTSKHAVLGWGDPSSFAYFYVNSSGFKSTFDVDTKKWLATWGDWFRVDPGYLKTKGIAGEYASAMQKEWFADWYVYEVVMKRKVTVSSDIPSNRIYFLGFPDNNPSGGWARGYEFYYYDDGYWYLKLRNNGEITTIASGTSTAIKPYDWNKLTVFTDYPFIDIWINETWLGFYSISDDPVYYESGYVGVGGYNSGVKSSLLVDRAKLKYQTTFPYPFAMNADGTRDPAHELKLDPTLVEPKE